MGGGYTQHRHPQPPLAPSRFAIHPALLGGEKEGRGEFQLSFPNPLDNVPIMFHLCLRWFWKGGIRFANLSILPEPCAAPAGGWRSLIHSREPRARPWSNNDSSALEAEQPAPRECAPLQERTLDDCRCEKQRKYRSSPNFGTNRCVSKLGTKPNTRLFSHYRMLA